MSRKVLISFLGANTYKQCVYVLNGDESSVVTYVQEAIIQLSCNDFQSNDSVLFCMTNAAKNKHLKSLTEVVSKYKHINPVYLENIKDGFSESEIWDIFQLIYEYINQDDELYLDITHGFRSLPMLGMVLLNYAKMLKNITVGGIYYGAFESLGTSFDIETRIPDPKDRKSPLLNLKAFSELQDWTNAASIFFELGSTKKLIKVADENKFLPALLSPKNQNRLNAKFKSLSIALSKYSLDIYTNRGDNIIENINVEKLINNIDEISSVISCYSDLRPFYYILELIKLRLVDYKSNSLENGFIAIQYCIDSQLYQQGITLLQEFTISFLVKDLGLDKWAKEDLKTIRITIENLLKSGDENTELKKKEILNDVFDIKNKIETSSLCKSIVQDYKSFSFEYRNDINHAGFGRKGKASSEFETALIKNFTKLKTIILDHQN